MGAQFIKLEYFILFFQIGDVLEIELHIQMGDVFEIELHFKLEVYWKLNKHWDCFFQFGLLMI